MRYDDYGARMLFAEMSPQNRRKVLKGGFRRVGNYMRKAAVNNLRASGLNHAAELSAGIRVVVFKREAGVRVTVASRKANAKGRGERGMHRNRYGDKKPVLVWAEAGTRFRKTEKRSRVMVAPGQYRITKRRGFMKRYGFLAKTRTQVSGEVTGMMRKEIINSVEKIAKKYGCK